MCGITGWANKDADALPIYGDEALLKSMCDRMLHRGPDSEGLLVTKGFALGMRRLSIIDLKTGDQPVWNEGKTVVAVMNGEIYNFRELRKELESLGYKFFTESDTEVLPHLYEEYGDDLVDKLNGMFAIALWDFKKDRLILFRDRFGEKPLYYGVFGENLFFASELKVLLSHPEINPELDLASLQSYLSYDYVPAPLSIYKGISKLPAAHKLVWENGAPEVSKYWKLSFHKKEKKPTIAEASSETAQTLSQSVKKRLVSDVPLGVLLSGGIDSSTIAAFAQEHSSKKVKTFSIGFEEDSFDESEYAREVASHLETEHYEDRLSVDSAKDLIGDIGEWLDEPLSDGSLIPTYLLSRFVRKHVTVALGGDGGDEIFAGYPMYLGHKVARMYDMIPRVLRSRVIEPIVNSLPTRTNNLSFDYKAKRFVRASNNDLVTRHHSWFGSFSVDETQGLLAAFVRSETKDIDIYAGAKRLLKECNALDEIEQMQFLDMNYYLAEDILAKVDRASMAVSLEVRAPFLDQHVAEYAASLPSEYKLRGRTTKFILKNAVKDLLPDRIINRPKKGFGIPIADWLKGSLKPLMRDMLSEERILKQGLFSSRYVENLMREHENGTKNHYKQLWTLLVFQLWYENFG